MKSRDGFVSNSSSSSFVIPRNKISAEQAGMIADHLTIYQKMVEEGKEDAYHNKLTALSGYDEWRIDEEDGNLVCTTTMDNFDMGWFLADVVGLPDDFVDSCHRDW